MAKLEEGQSFELSVPGPSDVLPASPQLLHLPTAPLTSQILEPMGDVSCVNHHHILPCLESKVSSQLKMSDHKDDNRASMPVGQSSLYLPVPSNCQVTVVPEVEGRSSPGEEQPRPGALTSGSGQQK